MIYFKKTVKNNPIINNKKIILVNFGQFYPFVNIKNYRNYISSGNNKLILSYENCSKFKAYQFEGYNIKERKNLDKIDLRMKAYINTKLTFNSK